MKYKIAVTPGDGVGPEVVAEALKVLNRIGNKYDHKFEFTELMIGGAAIDSCGECLPEETIKVCKNSDAVLLGAVGGPKWDALAGNKRPEAALLGLRKALMLFANLRPAMVFEELADASPLKRELFEGGLDVLVVRELTGGIYFGEKNTIEDKNSVAAYDVEYYSRNEIDRIAMVAFEMAKKRNGKVTSIDKANVLESSRLWRKTVNEVHENYKNIDLTHMYVDNGAMQLVRNPRQFDVILTNNIFGDILSDEASQITGSIGMLPSASLSTGSFGLYEPVHGSAPDIAGQDKANPIATILSVAMMLRYSFNLMEEANDVEMAVKTFLADGFRTTDIFAKDGIVLGTAETGDKIVSYI